MCTKKAQNKVHDLFYIKKMNFINISWCNVIAMKKIFIFNLKQKLRQTHIVEIYDVMF